MIPRSLLPLFFAVPLAAQGLLITPLPPGPNPPAPQPHIAPQPAPQPWTPAVVRITKSSVRADIVDGVATTVVEQTYRNDGGRDAEGTWILPLPAGAVADGFKMIVGGKEVAGEVLDANQARGVYEQIVRQRRDPGLLEYAGEGLLRARIFPIPAMGEVGVTVRLRQVLQPTGGLYEWRWPVRSQQIGDAGRCPMVLEVKISSQTPLASVLAPYATAEIRRDGDRKATVSLEGANPTGEDLRVIYGLSEQEFGLHLLPFRGSVDPGYFAMLLSPPRDLAKDQTPRRCVQFVIDTSGSMAGDKIQQAKNAVRAFLASLREQDRFQIVSFASSVQPFFDGPVPATRENVAAAQQRVDQLNAMGGTNIGEALQKVLETPMPPADGAGSWLGQVVFVTDGQPTVGLCNPQQILDLTRVTDRQSVRVFALGVGDEVDARLLDDLVQQHHGARDYVRNQEKIEVKVDALCQKLAQPALTDVEVRCDGLDAFDVHPNRTRDLFCGELLQVVGRYRDHGVHTVRVRGKQNGRDREFVFQVDFPALAEQHSFVPTLWARAHVASLLDEIRRNGQKGELVDEVRRLATRYGIVTPYTSQLIVEEGMRLAGNTPPAEGRWGDLGGARDGAGGTAVGGGAGHFARGARGGASGPVTSGPTGPSTGGPGAPAPERAAAKPADQLQQLGRARTGAEAVKESLATGSDDFYLGDSRKAAEAKDKDARERVLVRRVGDRTFVVIGEDLVEQGLPADWAKTAVDVEAFSDAYFALLKANPKLREVLALGDRIVFRDGERIVHVKPAPAPAPKAEGGEVQAPGGK